MANYDAKIIVGTSIDTKEIVNAEKEVERLTKRLDEVRECSKRLLELGANENQLKSLGYDAEKLEKQLKSLGYDAEKLKKQLNEGKPKNLGNFSSLSDKVEQFQTELKDLRDKGFGIGDKLFDDTYISLQNALYAENEYTKNLDKSTEKGISEEKARQAKEQERLAKEQERLAKEQAKERERLAKEQDRIAQEAERNLQRENERLFKEIQKEEQIKKQAAEEERIQAIKENAVVADQREVELIKEKTVLEERLRDLKKAGVTQGYKEYNQITSRLKSINDSLSKIAKNRATGEEKVAAALQNETTGFKRALQSAKKLFSTIDTGTKKSNTGLAIAGKMLNRMLLRMMMLKAITGVFGYFKEGVNNLVQYSTELNGVFSDLKSSSAQLKNSLATAFSPILTMIIPYITQLIGWLNTAMNYIAQFWAVLGGRNTYTRAKKQVVDYAKSLGTATKAAKGALAAFDEINVLNRDDGSGAGGTSGSGTFEEIPIDSGFAETVEKVKSILEAILPLVILIGSAFLTWKVFGIIDSLMEMCPFLGNIVGFVILIAGTALAIYNYLKMWEDGVNWKNLIGFVSGVAIAVGALWALFGPVAAGIGLITFAIAGVVLALKDMIENGVTAENLGLILISCFGLLIGVFLTFGATAAVVVGIILLVVGVLAMLVAYGGNGAEALQHLKDTFKALGDFVKKVFAGDFKGALEDLKRAGKSFGNFFISVAEGIANGFIKMVNAIIDAINSLHFDVPDWVPIFGGESFSPDIPHWNAHVSLPRLATGGIVTSSTLANIGEAGREAVLPLENNTEWMDALADRINSGRSIRIVFTGDLAELGRVLKPVIDAENMRIGDSLQMT